MLEKIEAAYLAVMRVVVLIAATIALFICVVGASQAAPVVLRQLGWVSAEPAETPGLAAFIEERKISQMPAAGVQVAPVATAGGEGTIDQTTRIITDYVTTRSKEFIDADALRRVLQERHDAFDAEHQADFADSLLVLANELKVSKGRPLGLAQVADLLDWHHTRFLAQIEQAKLNELTQATKAQAGLGLAMGGLIAFVLILFFFLFVKIERNLRLVRTREVTAP